MLKLLLTLYTFLPQVADKAARMRKYAPAQPDEGAASLYQSLMSFDWRWFVIFLVGAAVSFGILLFGLLFFRRWGVPRLGYFIVTILVLLNRAMQPGVLFWQAFGVAAGLVCFFMAFHSMTDRKHVANKEPVYFMLNSFALFVSSLWTSYFLTGTSAAALFASLFFVTTKNPRKPGGHGQADKYVLESLERKAQRK